MIENEVCLQYQHTLWLQIKAEAGSLSLVSLPKSSIITLLHITIQVVWKDTDICPSPLLCIQTVTGLSASHGSFKRAFVPTGCSMLHFSATGDVTQRHQKYCSMYLYRLYPHSKLCRNFMFVLWWSSQLSKLAQANRCCLSPTCPTESCPHPPFFSGLNGVQLLPVSTPNLTCGHLQTLAHSLHDEIILFQSF